MQTAFGNILVQIGKIRYTRIFYLYRINHRLILFTLHLKYAVTGWSLVSR